MYDTYFSRKINFIGTIEDLNKVSKSKHTIGDICIDASSQRPYVWTETTWEPICTSEDLHEPERVKVHTKTNCPCCGAPVTDGEYCEFCGVPYTDYEYI